MACLVYVPYLTNALPNLHESSEVYLLNFEISQPVIQLPSQHAPVNHPQ